VGFFPGEQVLCQTGAEVDRTPGAELIDDFERGDEFQHPQVNQI
jgi:hypothetical protein